MQNQEIGFRIGVVIMETFSKYMIPPEEPNGNAYEEDGWIKCCYCGKKQFPIDNRTIIRNLHYACKNSKCKREILINHEVK